MVIDFCPYMGTSETLSSYVGEFHNGLAFVTKDLYWIIDKDGNNVFMGDSLFFISDFQYNEEYDVIPGYVYVDVAMKERMYGFMGLDGRQRLEPVFDYIYPPHGKYVVVKKLINGAYWCGVIELIL